MKTLSLAFFLFLVSPLASSKQLIPMSNSVYNGKYFLLNNVKKNGINTIIYQSNFNSGKVFSKMEINCKTRKYRKIGESTDSVNSIEIYNDKGSWISAYPKASHDDVVKFVCKKS